MNHIHVSQVFTSQQYEKTGLALITAFNAKVEKLKAKIEERTVRINTVREQYKIDDKALIELLLEAQRNPSANSYSTRAVGAGREEVVLAAGVVQNILTEHRAIEGEKEQVDKCERVVRNLNKDATYRVEYDDLVYLGF
jgi:hypothetical protein